MVAGLVGLDIAARLLPHAPNFTPVAATALFAASVLRTRALSAAGADRRYDARRRLVLGAYDLRIMIAVYGDAYPAGVRCVAVAAPALAANDSHRFCRHVR